MAAAQIEHLMYTHVTWKSSLHIYGGLTYNALMADTWSDRTVLHDAAYQGRPLNMRTLVSQGWDVNILTTDKVSPLHEACLGGHYACAKILLENGANVEAVSADGATPLSNACSSGSAACVRLILQSYPLVYTSPHLVSPIHVAAKTGHRECLELLLSHGAHIDLELPEIGTPLYSACVAKTIDCVKRLLHSGADVHIGCEQDSPLHAAVRGGAVTVVELLMDYGADGSWRNAEGKTPLDLAPPNSAVRSALQNKGPCLLSEVCRFHIRRSLGWSRLHRTSGLFLPHSLKDFLLYQGHPSML